MSHYVEEHFNEKTGAKIPGYWLADGAAMLWPCDTKEQADYLESQLDDDGIHPYQSMREMLLEMPK